MGLTQQAFEHIEECNTWGQGALPQPLLGLQLHGVRQLRGRVRRRGPQDGVRVPAGAHHERRGRRVHRAAAHHRHRETHSVAGAGRQNGHYRCNQVRIYIVQKQTTYFNLLFST